MNKYIKNPACGRQRISRTAADSSTAAEKLKSIYFFLPLPAAVAAPPPRRHRRRRHQGAFEKKDFFYPPSMKTGQTEPIKTDMATMAKNWPRADSLKVVMCL